MARTHRSAPHTAWYTPRRTCNLLLAVSHQAITEHAMYGNHIPGVDDTPYDDILRDAAQWKDTNDA